MATYEFPYDEPHHHCLDNLVTGGKCCGNEGLARINCKLLPPVDGHNKAREAKRGTKHPTIWDFAALVTAFSIPAYYILERFFA